jgi:hypothetical protein
LFVLAKTDQYSWPVVVQMPKSGGQWDKMSFDVTFKRLRQSEIKKWFEDSNTGDKDFCRSVVVGWKGIQSEDKQDVPFSHESLEVLLDEPQVATAIAKAYLESVSGAPAKN